MGKIIIVFTGLVMCLIMGAASCSEKKPTIILPEPTELLQIARHKNAPGNKVLAVLEKGTSGVILDTTYSKSFMFYKIKTNDGRIGYVMALENMKIVKPADRR